MSSSSPPITTAITVVTAPAPAATGPSELHTIIKHSADLSKMDTAPALNDAVPPQSGDGLQESTKQNVVEEDMVDATVEAEAENGNDDAQSEDAQPLTLEQAMACLHEGKRHLKCHEYAKAADCFSKVSETFALEYGEKAPELGEVLYYYGDALLQLASEEQTLIGGGGEDDNEESEAKNTEEATDDMALTDGNLQLAWEALECARVIFLDDAARVDQLAQVYMKLGEHGHMREDYKQALDDFNESLRLRETIVQPNDRVLAEIRYLLGLCYMYDKQFQEAQAMYNQALSVLRARVVAEPSEAEELKDVMTDLEEKIEESKQLQSEKDKAEREAALLIRGAFSSIFGQSSAGDQPTAMASSAFPDAASSQPTSSTVVVRDLGGLVRKRKAPTPTSVTEDDQSENKKGKTAAADE